MGHPVVEEGVGFGSIAVHVGIEGVAGEFREMLDIFQRDLPRCRDQLVADAQFGQRLAEGVVARLGIRAFDPAARDS